jgi:hypothetical protein
MRCWNRRCGVPVGGLALAFLAIVCLLTVSAHQDTHRTLHTATLPAWGVCVVGWLWDVRPEAVQQLLPHWQMLGRGYLRADRANLEMREVITLVEKRRLKLMEGLAVYKPKPVRYPNPKPNPIRHADGESCVV